MTGPETPMPGQVPNAGGAASAGGGTSDEVRSAVVLAMAIAAGLLGLAVVLVLFPHLLAWLIALGVLAFILVALLAILVAVVAAMLAFGVGAFFLFRPREVQGPEASYTLDMVKEPKREGR